MPRAPYSLAEGRPLADRLLVELVRSREEAAGHPALSPDADAAAIAAGGDLMQRICARAHALPDAPAQRAGIEAALRIGRLLAVAVLFLFAVLGVGVASTALGATRPASLPLVLLSIIGINVVMLALWLLAQPFSGRIGAGVGALFRRAWTTLAAATSASDAAPPGMMHLLASGAIGRWLLGSLVHAAWLVFSIAALAALTGLLSLRSYQLAWESTLLSTEALATWARALSWGPSLLGLTSVDPLSVTDTGSALARQAWARWLLSTVCVYGVLPRALALGVCLVLLRRALAPLGRDPARPGFARLRARLMPDHQPLGVADPAPPAPLPASAAVVASGGSLRGAVHGLALEGVAAEPPPPLPGVDWIWLGAVDDGASRRDALARLRAASIESLAVVVRATLSPDRGLERFVAELVAAARAAPVWLVLDRFERLQARGEADCRQRLADWQALASRAGANGGVVTCGGAPVAVASSNAEHAR